MNSAENNLLQSLTGNADLHSVTIEQLQNIVNTYPYFPVAHFLLAKKMKQENHPELLQQLQKTALYFPNVHWLHYQLTKQEERNDVLLENTESVKELVAHVEEHEAAIPHLETKEDIPVELNEDVTPAQTVDELPPLDEEETLANTEDIPAPQLAKLAEVLNEQVAEFKKPVQQTDALPIEPEPYHTVDYFASQGIKLEANQQEDKLDKKVRKFTDWLKQMKRINPQPTDLGTEEAMEHAVQNIAATSNEPKDVVTEAMAEVLVKQGKTEKALELYSKLSFLNPAKSAYFAAKIQELKGSAK